MLRRAQTHLSRNGEDISLALKIEAVWRALLTLNMCMRSASLNICQENDDRLAWNGFSNIEPTLKNVGIVDKLFKWYWDC